MTTATQQIPSNPAHRLAGKILARTDNGQELIDLLHDISKGGHNANKNDRVTAAKYLFERGYGKCPRQPLTLSEAEPKPVLSMSKGRRVEGSERSPESAESDNHANQSSDTLPEGGEPALSAVEGSPRLVTQVEDALNDSIGPAPSTHTPTPVISHPFDPFSIQASIQAYIIEITNDGDTLVDTLLEIVRADDDDPTVTSYHRTRATRILTDRALGTNPYALQSAFCPDCRQSWSTHTCSPAHHEPSSFVGQVEDQRTDDERWAIIEAKLKRMEDEGILTPDPNAPPIDISGYRMPKDFDSTPYEKEEAEAFRAEIALQVERQKNWPKIEERRRKKLAQLYPSHSEDDEPPDT